MKVVYGDILFIINFSMDFLILFGVGRVLHLKTRLFFLSAAAVLGGIYSVAALLIPSGALRTLSAFAVSFLLCFIAYGKQRLGRYLKSVLMFYGGSVLLGGAVSACYTLIDSLAPDITPGSDMTDIPLWIFAVICIVSVVFSLITGRLWGKQKEKTTVSVEVIHKGKRCTLTLLCDSGNTLTEPISGLPVIVTEKRYLPAEGYGETNLRIIPTKTASGTSVLYGFVPECVIINERNADCVVALAESGTFNDCDGVIPYSLI